MRKEVRNHPFFIVADDLGAHPSVNKGIYSAIEHNALTGADVMIGSQYTREAINEIMRNYPHISIGLHIVAFPSGPTKGQGPKILEFRGLPDPTNMLLRPLLQQTEKQLKQYQDLLGENPPHISTHQHTHKRPNGEIFPQFIECLQRILGEDLPGVLIRTEHTQEVRHTSWTMQNNGIPPLSPENFREEIIKLRDGKPVEFLVHPAINNEDVPFTYDYPLYMRSADLHGLLDIARSNVITSAGFEIISPTTHIRKQEKEMSQRNREFIVYE
jgi:predicted glycoside hydrolase/deacetylase ChbG (UPF0249 family)